MRMSMSSVAAGASGVVAHVSPSVGLYASFIMAMTIAIVGGRSAMIYAATSAYTTAGTCTRLGNCALNNRIPRAFTNPIETDRGT